jgi:hypothetical protein
MNLYQAVKILDDRKIMHPEAVVALFVVAGGEARNAYFPARDFLRLARSGFHADAYAAWMDKARDEYGDTPPIPKSFPTDVGMVFTDIRRKTWSWDVYDDLWDHLFPDDAPDALQDTGLMTLEAFQRKTKVGLKPRRFTNASGIDTALKRYWDKRAPTLYLSGPGAIAARAAAHAALVDLMAAIDDWLRVKAGSTKSKRRTTVQMLRQQVLAEEQTLRPLLNVRADRMAGF